MSSWHEKNCPRCGSPFIDTWPWLRQCDECYAKEKWVDWRWAMVGWSLLAIVAVAIPAFCTWVMLADKPGDGSEVFVVFLFWLVPLVMVGAKWLEVYNEPRCGSHFLDNRPQVVPWVGLKEWRDLQFRLMDRGRDVDAREWDRRAALLGHRSPFEETREQSALEHYNDWQSAKPKEMTEHDGR